MNEWGDGRSEPFPSPSGLSQHLRVPWIAWLLACCVALSLPLVAAAGTTSARVAQPALARLVDGLTGTEALLRADEIRLRDAADEAGAQDLLEVAGFPVRGAGIPRDDVLSGTREQWRRTLLDRAAALLYDQGTRVFAEHPEAARVDFGGGAWALNLLDGRVHGWLVILQWPPILACVVLTVGLLVMEPPLRRWRLLGLAITVGATLPFLLTLATLLLATLAGGEPGTLSDEAAEVIATLAKGPLIQSGTVLIGGLILWWWSNRPVREEQEEVARLAAAHQEREARRRAAAGLPPEPRQPR